mgnify:CR=1 FL=1
MIIFYKYILRIHFGWLKIHGLQLRCGETWGADDLRWRVEPISQACGPVTLLGCHRFPPKSIHNQSESQQNHAEPMRTSTKIHKNLNNTYAEPIRTSTKNPSESQQNPCITPSTSQEAQSRPPSDCAELLPDSGCWCQSQLTHTATQQQSASTSTEGQGHQQTDRIPASASPGIHAE